METVTQIVLDFVEGRVSGKDFEQHLYHNADLETLLADPKLKWHDTYIKTNPYDYAIGLHYDEPGGVLDAQGAMELFLQRKGLPYKRTKVYSDFYGLLLKAQPKWLGVEISYISDHILPEANGRSGQELQTWLRIRLKELFRYYKKPPKWIQSPAWPINENGPMYFLGQINLDDCELFHDAAAVFVFMDVKSREIRSVVQVY